MNRIIRAIMILLGALTRKDLAMLSPVDRERFKQRLQYWARVAEKVDRAEQRGRGGVLDDLKKEPRDE